MCDPDFQRVKNQNTELSKTDTPIKFVSLFTGNRPNNVFVQTARAFLSSKENSNKLLVRLVIDGGSKLSFIRETLSRQLHLEVVGKHKMSVFSFGNKDSLPAKEYNRVNVCIQSQYSSEIIKISAIEVPEICVDMPSSDDPSIQGLCLADVNVHNVKMIEGISMLIGPDSYWNIVTNENIKISEKLMAVNTSLGWTLHGEYIVKMLLLI